MPKKVLKGVEMAEKKARMKVLKQIWKVGKRKRGGEGGGTEAKAGIRTQRTKKGRINNRCTRKSWLFLGLRVSDVVWTTGLPSLLLGGFACRPKLRQTSDVSSSFSSTALFAFPLRPDVASDDIRRFDFGQPVLNFAIVEDDSMLVSLDVNWRNPGTSVENVPEATGSTPTTMVRVVKLLSGQVKKDFYLSGS